MNALKFVGPDTVEGLAIPFGSSEDRDLDGEYFTASTDLAIDWFGKSGRPSLYDHGFDDTMKMDIVGRQVDFETREEGVWAQVQLDRNARYRKAIDRMVGEGALGYSSGAMSHLVTKSGTGEITRWPWVELSLTPIPAHPGTLGVHYVKSATAFERMEAVQMNVPAPVKAALAALDEWADNRGDPPAGEPFAEHSDRLLVEVKAWADRARGIHEMRVKSGRVLSEANRARIAALIEAWEPSLADLKALLAETDPEAGKALHQAEFEALMTLARLNGVPV